MTRLTRKDTWLNVSSQTTDKVEKTEWTFKDTEPTEVCKRALQFFHGCGTCHVCLGGPSLAFLLYPSHLLKIGQEEVNLVQVQEFKVRRPRFNAPHHDEASTSFLPMNLY